MASADTLRAAHSPLPWAVQEDCKTSIWSGGHYVAETYDGGEDTAAFITRACNAHYQMLEALKEVRALVGEAALTGFNWQDGDWPTKLFENQAKLSAAIRAAEAESR